MLPLFDMMLKAQNGAATEAMAKQFSLAQDQAAQAMAALMPAFSSGLKRSTANPYDFTQLMGTMMSGSYAKYFEDLGRAFTPQGMADGNAVLEKLFGSKDVSRAIAAQAEQLTGIGQDIFKKMMPAMADTLMGGLFKQATGQMQQNSDMFASSPMGQMTRQWLDGLGLQPKSGAATPADMFDNPFMQNLRSIWGLDAAAQKTTAASPSALGENPFFTAFQSMMGTFAQPGTGSVTDKVKAGTASSNPYVDALNSMFDSGLDVQKSYQKSMESIFDTYLGGKSPAGTKPDSKT